MRQCDNEIVRVCKNERVQEKIFSHATNSDRQIFDFLIKIRTDTSSILIDYTLFLFELLFHSQFF